MTKILVIEDDPEVLDNIQDTLEASGFEVAGAANGRIGLEVLGRQLPDLVLCDVMMPELTGPEVLKSIRSDQRMNTLPFIFLTAKSDRSDLRQGMELGADDYITKPFTQVELLSAIDTQLQKRETLNEKHETTLRVLRRNIIYALPHELRTPLTHILGFSDMMRQDAALLSPDDVEGMADTVFRAGKRLERLFENYLVYAQIEIISGDAIELEALRNHIIKDAAAVVASVAKQVAENAKRSSDLVLDLGSAAVCISDESLTKIIQELIDNACKFSNAGSRIVVKSANHDHQYVIGIRDYGRGMSEEQLMQVGPYMQFDRTLHEQQGLGLGFAIAKKLVELHHGSFDVKSAPDKGTLVRISFPI